MDLQLGLHLSSINTNFHLWSNWNMYAILISDFTTAVKEPTVKWLLLFINWTLYNANSGNPSYQDCVRKMSHLKALLNILAMSISEFALWRWTLAVLVYGRHACSYSWPSRSLYSCFLDVRGFGTTVGSGCEGLGTTVGFSHRDDWWDCGLWQWGSLERLGFQWLYYSYQTICVDEHFCQIKTSPHWTLILTAKANLVVTVWQDKVIG